MAMTGPFEACPEIAVACSGGADSLTLALLIDAWARARGGTATALIVDHGIRENSLKEAEAVAVNLGERGMTCEILCNKTQVGTSNIQATARKVRYELLQRWCSVNGNLHLAFAHNQEDQAETVLLRLARGSGSDGLAAMAPISETPSVRILRPLLGVPRTRLQATLDHWNVKHIDDPSNRNRKFARVRMRSLSPVLAAEGLTAQRLAGTAARLARTRNSLESEVAVTLARSAIVYPSGYCHLSPQPLCRMSEEIALRALARVLICIGGNGYTPRLERIERLYAWLQDGTPGGGRTLAGCRLLPCTSGLLVCREVSAAKSVVPAKGNLLWDGRFRLRLGTRSIGDVKRLGTEGWRLAVAAIPALRKSTIPSAVMAGLPAIWKDRKLRSVPHLGLLGSKKVLPGRHPHKSVFAPLHPLVPACFTLQKSRYTLSK